MNVGGPKENLEFGTMVVLGRSWGGGARAREVNLRTCQIAKSILQLHIRVRKTTCLSRLRVDCLLEKEE